MVGSSAGSPGPRWSASKLLLAVVALSVLVALIWIPLLRKNANAGSRSAAGESAELLTGDWSLPVAGVLLDAAPLPVLRQIQAGVGTSKTGRILQPDEAAYFARDWSTLVVARSEVDEKGDVLTRAQLPWVERSLPGEHSFRPLGPEAVLALSLRPDSSGKFAVELLRPGSEVTCFTRQPLWVAGAASAARIAVATLSEVTLFGADGVQQLVLPGLSSVGDLSEDWLAIEQERDAASQLSLYSLDSDSPVKQLDVSPGLEVRLDPRGRLLVHIAGETLTVVELAPPHRVERLSAPGSARWRSCAFDATGRLAVSWIQVEQALVAGRGPERTRGKARLGVELLHASTWPPEREGDAREWTVAHWNGRSPELAFDARGRLFALAWPASFEVRL